MHQTEEKLFSLIVRGKIGKAKKVFLEMVLSKENRLWEHAAGKQYSPYLSQYKENVLLYAFGLLIEKIKKNKVGGTEQLKGVIVNTIREAMREYRREIKSEYEEYIPGVTPFELPDDDGVEELIEWVLFCLESLGEPCRKLITLKWLECRSHDEIVAMNIGFGSRESSRAKLSQCMNRLREKVFKKQGI